MGIFFYDASLLLNHVLLEYSVYHDYIIKSRDLGTVCGTIAGWNMRDSRHLRMRRRCNTNILVGTVGRQVGRYTYVVVIQ
jgi:hypothetical protein